jgi:hypothetical protein
MLCELFVQFSLVLVLGFGLFVSSVCSKSLTSALQLQHQVSVWTEKSSKRTIWLETASTPRESIVTWGERRTYTEWFVCYGVAAVPVHLSDFRHVLFIDSSSFGIVSNDLDVTAHGLLLHIVHGLSGSATGCLAVKIISFFFWITDTSSRQDSRLSLASLEGVPLGSSSLFSSGTPDLGETAPPTLPSPSHGL